MEKPIQTRSEINGLNYFETIKDALAEAKKDDSIWKISFSLRGERVRLIKYSTEGFMLHPMDGRNCQFSK